MAVMKAISKLFSILHQWQAGGGLALELSIQSPSDREHNFKNLYFGGDNENGYPDIDCSGYPSAETPSATIHDPKHGWIDGVQVHAPREGAILRIFEPTRLRNTANLPLVPAVTKFVLRRQCRRQIEPKTLGHLLSKLPRLESLIYEPWQQWSKGEQKSRDEKGYCGLIRLHLPSTVKRVSLFEETSKPYAKILSLCTPSFGRPRVGPTPVSSAVANRSLNLEHLSAAFIVEARDFFISCQPSWFWEHLQSLALTSDTLSRKANLKDVLSLLQNAAKAALSMPRLHTLTLWNTSQGEACKFSYHVNPAVVTWRGTWDLKLDSCTIQDWTKVARKQGQHDLQVKRELLSTHVNSQGHAVELLDLPCGVVDPGSLWQMRREMVSGWQGR
ncbi:oxoglutarate iron-dependent oxygenase [Colletotrichum asianum]|uniref:Oxoglutarate iron-dependent oxygenase n=1 Tax=Colletotrichum asianum TaxID=702518 RepID=A0A8H3ZMZ3_9PEZI|nr:oxoglutarate iron-dependent oxygenase [Colletotrichum asianum]